MTRHRAWRRAGLWGFAAGGLLFVIGAPLPHSVLVAVAIAATGPVLDVASIELRDRPEVPRHLRRSGSRHELATLTRYRGRRRRGTDIEAVRRLAMAARRRLSDLGIDVDDPTQVSRARRLLGPLAYGVLIDRSASPPIPHHRFADCIDAVEDLGRRRQDREVGASVNGRGAS